jgi:hypothetical protein
VTAALREPRPVNLRMRDSPHWGVQARPVVTSKVVEVGDTLPGGWVVVAVTTERGVEQIWLADPEGTRRSQTGCTSCYCSNCDEAIR